MQRGVEIHVSDCQHFSDESCNDTAFISDGPCKENLPLSFHFCAVLIMFIQSVDTTPKYTLLDYWAQLDTIICYLCLGTPFESLIDSTRPSHLNNHLVKQCTYRPRRAIRYFDNFRHLVCSTIWTYIGIKRPCSKVHSAKVRWMCCTISKLLTTFLCSHIPGVQLTQTHTHPATKSIFWHVQ